MIRSTTLVAGCVSALALVGCGGGVTTASDEATTTSQTVTQATAGTTATTSEAVTTTAAETTSPPPETTTTIDRTATSTPATVPDEDDAGDAVTGEVPPELMDRVFAAAEGESNIDRSAMAVLRAESVIWSDGSLGCPEPGTMYTQATVDGYWVELAAGDRTMDYRLSADGQIRLCESDGTTLPGRDS